MKKESGEPVTTLKRLSSKTGAKLSLYNSELEQDIPLEIEKNNHTFRVSHKLKPLSDERYFQSEREKIEVSKRIVKNGTLTTSAYTPVENLWNDLVISREGYKNNPDNFREKTYLMDKVNAVSALLSAHIVEEKSEIAENELLLDDEFEIKLRVLQSGVLIETTHFFKEESRAEMDEYLAVFADKPNPNAIASAARPETSAERMCALYDSTCTSVTGYAEGSRVPAWHKTVAAIAHFSRQFARLGK